MPAGKARNMPHRARIAHFSLSGGVVSGATYTDDLPQLLEDKPLEQPRALSRAPRPLPDSTPEDASATLQTLEF